MCTVGIKSLHFLNKTKFNLLFIFKSLLLAFPGHQFNHFEAYSYFVCIPGSSHFTDIYLNYGTPTINRDISQLH